MTEKRITRRSARGCITRGTVAEARPITATATTTHARRSRLLRRAASGAGTPAFDPASAIHLSSWARSRADCQRSSGSFARQRWTIRSRPGGVRGWISEIGRGCSFKTEAISEAWLFPSNALRPVAIS